MKIPRRWRRAALALGSLATLVLGAGARAETCECRDVGFAWAGCAEGAASCDQAGWTGCSASPDDSFAVRSGCHVDVAPGADVLIEQPVALDRFLVAAGGSVTVRGPVEWRVGPGGFLARAGSRVELAGCFRRFAGEGEACTESLGPDNLFSAGSIVPCRDGECADGDAHLVRLAYAPDATGALAEAFSGLDAARDALCFWQDDEQGYVGGDAGYCYRIAAIGSDPAAPFLDFDIRQVWRTQSDQAGYPLARRLVKQGTLAGSHAAGERELRFAETDVVEGRIDQMGRWVRCGDGQQPYLIASVRDEPSGDVLVLADDRGLAIPSADGERCHVDWGWSPGDRAFVMAPVHVTSAVEQSNAAFLRLEGAASLRAVVVDGLGGSSSPPRGALQVVGGPLERFEHVWVTDPLVRDREAVFLDDLPCDASVHHLTITGGPVEPAYDKNYGLLWFGGATCTYHLTHFYPRFRGDDNFVLESTGAQPLDGIVIRYVHAGPSSLPGDSGQLLDLGTTNPTTVDAADMLCTACTTQDGAGALIGPTQGKVTTVARTLWVGAFNGGAVSNFYASDAGVTRFVDFGLVGSAVDPAKTGGFGPLAGHDAERFYVRDYADPRPISSRACVADITRTKRLARGVFRNVQLGSIPCDLGGAPALEDVYFVDVGRIAATGPLLRLRADANGARLARTTMAFRSPPAGITHGVDVIAGARALVDGPLLTGFAGPGVARAMQVGSAEQAALLDWGAPTCFHANDADDDEAVIAAYGTPPIRGVDPLFVSPEFNRFDLRPESPLRAAGCGAATAGVLDRNWAHRKAKLRPVYMGPRPSACGLSSLELLLALALWERVRAARRRARAAQASSTFLHGER